MIKWAGPAAGGVHVCRDMSPVTCTNWYRSRQRARGGDAEKRGRGAVPVEPTAADASRRAGRARPRPAFAKARAIAASCDTPAPVESRAGRGAPIAEPTTPRTSCTRCGGRRTAQAPRAGRGTRGTRQKRPSRPASNSLSTRYRYPHVRVVKLSFGHLTAMAAAEAGASLNCPACNELLDQPVKLPACNHCVCRKCAGRLVRQAEIANPLSVVPVCTESDMKQLVSVITAPPPHTLARRIPPPNSGHHVA
jgi:hypothetical protein